MDRAQDSFIEEDDASKFSEILPPRLDSGFLSGGSLPSTCLSSVNLQHSKDAHLSPSSSYLGAASRELSRMDSGLCEQMSESLTLSDPQEILNTQQPSSLHHHHQQQHASNIPPVASPQPAPVPAAVVEQFYGVDADGDSQLHLAIADGATEIVFALIRMAPDPSYLDIQNNEMYAPLHIAVLVNQQAMVRRLVVAGAQTDIRDREGNTPLHLAAKRGHKDCAMALLSSISTEELKDSVVPHRHSSHQQHSPSTLLNLKNYNGEHCIHLATFGQHYELIWYLNLQQADVSSLEGRSGKTALHYAVNMGDERLVRLLATPKDMGGCGIWLNARDWSGRTALQCARINRDENIGNFIASVPGCDTNLDDQNTSDEDFEFDTEEEDICDRDYNDIEVNGIRIVNSIA